MSYLAIKTRSELFGAKHSYIVFGFVRACIIHQVWANLTFTHLVSVEWKKILHYSLSDNYKNLSLRKANMTVPFMTVHVQFLPYNFLKLNFYNFTSRLKPLSYFLGFPPQRGTPLDMPDRCGPPQTVWFITLFRSENRSTLYPFWSWIGYGFQRKYRSVWRSWFVVSIPNKVGVVLETNIWNVWKYRRQFCRRTCPRQLKCCCFAVAL